MGLVDPVTAACFILQPMYTFTVFKAKLESAR